jgi:anthraniloyl-CoA monooxygenase
MSVRISAHDWVDGRHHAGRRGGDRAAFKAAGADLIDVLVRPDHARRNTGVGRMYQTPFADRIRQEADIATMAVGAISEADHVNSDRRGRPRRPVRRGRPHLADPAWTLHRGRQAAEPRHQPAATLDASGRDQG